MRYCFLLLLVFFEINVSIAKERYSMHSPDRVVNATLYAENGNLKYYVQAEKTRLIEPSILGINIDDHILGKAVSDIKFVSKTTISEKYPLRGKRLEAWNKCTKYIFDITEGTLKYSIEFKLFDDGCAFRYLLKTEKKSSLVRGELTTFTLTPKTRVWYFERNSVWKLRSYAGLWQRTAIDSLPNISSQGPIQGKPLIVELPDGGYVMFSEAGLYNYSGMRFKATGKRRLEVNFTEEADGFTVNGDVITPWRVIGYAKDLNALVNTDIITNLNPAPDDKLYAETAYIKPGRAVWSWLTQHKEKDYMLPNSEKKFIDSAQKLGFEFTLIDEGWESKWADKWIQLQDLCRYGADRNVGVWIWKHSRDIRNPSVRDAFLDSVKAAGAVGVKTDFMNSESKELIDFEIGFLKACAARKLMVNFHGCHTSTGESRTYPNELTREGVRGLELNIMNEPIPASHNAALPFTRFVTGHGDYTPGLFSNKGNTTYAHQLAMFYLLESSFQCLADNPEYLSEPKLEGAVKMLKTFPVTWDETIVLPGSKIGVLAAMARRKGDVWYVAVINGTNAKYQYHLALSFLKKGTTYSATFITDNTDESLQEQTVILDRSYQSVYELLPTGGLLIAIKPSNNTADSVYQLVEKVANWQLNNWKDHGVKRDKWNWTNAVCYTGFMEFNKIAQNPQYVMAVYDIGKSIAWKTGANRTFADDYCVGQLYAQLYLHYLDPEIIRNFKFQADSIATLSFNESLEWKNKIQLREWAWCDALYMGPPALALLSTATGNNKYLDLADKLWWKTTEYLYDTEEHLYYRDSRFFEKRESNGKKMFWARGNGWVVAGLVRMLENMPQNYPSRSKYENIYKELVDKLIGIQHADGTWHTSLLDPQAYPSKETSGTALICYAITWGINNGLINKNDYYPSVEKAWKAMASAVHPDGKFGYVQEVNEKPGVVSYESTEVYGVGAFLLAGTQLYKLELSLNNADFKRNINKK